MKDSTGIALMIGIGLLILNLMGCVSKVHVQEYPDNNIDYTNGFFRMKRNLQSSKIIQMKTESTGIKTEATDGFGK